MSSRTLLQPMFGLTLVMLWLVGCSRTPAGPMITPTPIPATVTPVEVLVPERPVDDTSQEETDQPAPPTVTTTEIQATEQPIQDTSQEETDQPADNASALRTALAAHFGVSPDEIEFVIAEQTEEHATGGLRGAYFLAAREAGAWVIVYDGQATPGCAEIAPYDFPIAMVPECLDAENNLVVRTANQ